VVALSPHDNRLFLEQWIARLGVGTEWSRIVSES
jgi:hypothetical protein